MPAWVSVVVSIVIFIGGTTVQVYFKWVPDIEQQRQHFKRAKKWLSEGFWWGLNCVNIICLSWVLYMRAHRTQPVTPGFVVETSLISALLMFIVVFFLFTRVFSFVNRPSDSTRANGLLKDFFGINVGITKSVVEALKVIADKGGLAPEGERELKELLYGKPRQVQGSVLEVEDSKKSAAHR